MTGDSTTSHRTEVFHDPASEKGLYIGSAVCAAISVGCYLLVDSSWILWISIPTGLMAIGAFAAAWAGCYEGNCPNCGAKLSTIQYDEVKPTACMRCRFFYEGRNGWLSVVDPHRVYEEPVFSAPLPEKMRFPDCCCVCAAPPTRYDKKETHKLNPGWLLAGKISTTKITLRGIPYCDQHRDGAKIDSQHIVFRSYMYMLAFCRLNGLDPGPLKGFLDELDEEIAREEEAEAAQGERSAEPLMAEIVERREFSR